MNMKSFWSCLALVSGLAWVLTSVAPAETTTTANRTVNEEYPGLSSGILAHARLASLSEDAIISGPNVILSAADVNAELDSARAMAGDDADGAVFFIAEQIMASRIMDSQAGQALTRQGLEVSTDSAEMARTYFDLITSDTQVTDEEVATFYRNNQSLCGGATLEQMKSQIRPYLLGEKKEQAFQDHTQAIMRGLAFEVSREWADGAFRAARDNDVDRARWNKRPTLVNFGGASCCGPDQLLPMFDEVRETMAGRLDVVYVETREHQILAGRYNVNSIPTQIIYDQAGAEVFRHEGAISLEDLSAALSKAGFNR